MTKHLPVQHGALLLTWVKDLPGGMALMKWENVRMGGQRSWWLRLSDGTVRGTLTNTRGAAERLARKLYDEEAK